jgi:hypothetical protein
MALLSVSYFALAAASPSKVYAQSAPPAPEAGKTEAGKPEAPASPPSAPAEAPASPAPSAKPEAAPSSSAPVEKQEVPAAKSNEAPLPPVTIYPPREKPQPPVTQSREAPLPPVTIYPPRPKPRAKPTVQAAPAAPAAQPSPARRAGRPVKPTTATAAVSAATVANAMQAAIQAAWPASQTQGAKTGTSGVYTNSTSAATKINTPIVNIPQSLSVVTKEFIADNAFQNITDVTRYVPGVDVHQGEGNRDELIIRGVDSSANFFVNGFRDDVQIFRDFYKRAECRNPKRAECDHVRPQLRWRTAQPHLEGSRRPAGLRDDGADRVVGRSALYPRCRPGRQRELRRAFEYDVRKEWRVPAVFLS